MTTREKVIDALWAMGDWGEHRAGEVYDALVAAGVVIVDETPQPPLEPKLTITEPMPPSMIEAIEGTVWLAEHDAAIRRGIATAIEADILSDPSTANERSVARRDAFLARNWEPAEGDAKGGEE